MTSVSKNMDINKLDDIVNKSNNTYNSTIKMKPLHVKSSTYTEAVSQRCSVKMVFLKISQNSQENTCVGVSFLIKLHALGL